MRTNIRMALALLAVCGLLIAVGASAADNKADETKIITTDSGLKYIDLKVGTGDKAKKGDKVQVHYTGWLKNGKKFASSVDSGKPLEFELGADEVIKGWDEGVAGMKSGGKRKLIVPSKLAY